MNQADGANTEIQTLSCNKQAALYRFLQLSKTVQDRVEAELHEVGLSGAKFDVLVQLVRAGEPLPLRVLADGQQCVPSNMTTLIDRLENDGLVRRVDDPQDRRSRRAQLTERGEERIAVGIEVLDRLNSRFDDLIAREGGEELMRSLGVVGEF